MLVFYSFILCNMGNLYHHLKMTPQVMSKKYLYSIYYIQSRARIFNKLFTKETLIHLKYIYI